MEFGPKPAKPLSIGVIVITAQWKNVTGCFSPKSLRQFNKKHQQQLSVCIISELWICDLLNLTSAHLLQYYTCSTDPIIFQICSWFYPGTEDLVNGVECGD